MVAEAGEHSVPSTPEVAEAREDYGAAGRQFRKETGAEHEQVVALGGLYIIGTERHESRRIDNQLRGRSGRQGDPGLSRFYVSLEDDLMRLFGADNIMGIMDRLGMDDSIPIEHKLVSRSIETAQKKVENRNFETRKHVLDYDDVMNQQREVIYGQRRRVLRGDDLMESLEEMINGAISAAVDRFTAEGKYPEDWSLDELIAYGEQNFLPKNFAPGRICWRWAAGRRSKSSCWTMPGLSGRRGKRNLAASKPCAISSGLSCLEWSTRSGWSTWTPWISSPGNRTAGLRQFGSSGGIPV